MAKLVWFVVLWGCLELMLFSWIGKHWGGWVVVALLVGPMVLGRWLIRGMPLAGLRLAVQDSAASHLLRVLAGILLIVPGLVTDVLALFCLWPATGRWLQRHLVTAFGRARPESFASARGNVFDGEIIPEPSKHQLPPGP